MTAGPLLAGIDLGTTTCRCAVVDLDGRVVGTAMRETTTHYPRPLWAEVDPEAWWCQTASVVHDALSVSGVNVSGIASVGISGLMHAPVLLDAQDRPVFPAMLWMDQRCSEQVDHVRAAAARLGRANQVPLGTTFSAPKLAWLSEHQPATLRTAERLLLPKDYVRYRLTGVDGTDPSDAFGTGLYDSQAGDWMWDMVDALHVPGRLMPRIRPAESLAGYVTPDGTSTTGLPRGTPVAIGGGDGLCTRLGSGMLAPDEVCLYLGTAAWLAPAQFGKPWGNSTSIGFGATSATGAALRWLRDAFEAPHDYVRLVEVAEGVPPGSEGLLFLPHLMGERAPASDPLARGALVGLTLRHSYPHIARAVLEGTVFQLRRILDRGQAAVATGSGGRGSGVATGGVARSPLWMQLIADVTGLTLRVPETVESGVLGAAMLAATAASLLSLDTAQERMTRVGRTYSPNPQRAAVYDSLYLRYCELDDLLAPWFHATAGEARDGSERTPATVAPEAYTQRRRSPG